MLVLRQGFPHILAPTLLIILALAQIITHAADVPTATDSKLLETGGTAKSGSKAVATNEFKIVQYNIRWRGGKDLRELIKLFENDQEIGGAAVICLQEVDRNKKRTGNTNTARLMAEELGMHYAWAAPPQAKGKELEEEETGVAILSPFPITDVQRIVLPHAGPGGRRRVALGATVHIGQNKLRVYSVHAETRTTNEKRLEQFKAVLDDLHSHQPKHAVVLGDFNTITGKDVNATSSLFKGKGFETPFPNDKATWKTFILELKLDWVWLLGLEAVEHGIDKKIGFSDHWPLWTMVKLKDESAKK